MAENKISDEKLAELVRDASRQVQYERDAGRDPPPWKVATLSALQELQECRATR